jgi:hypothetical protein
MLLGFQHVGSQIDPHGGGDMLSKRGIAPPVGNFAIGA